LAQGSSFFIQPWLELIPYWVLRYTRRMLSYVEHRLSPLEYPGLQFRHVFPFCNGELLDPADAENASRKRSHSCGHSSLISAQVNNHFSIRRPAPVKTSTDKGILSKTVQKFHLPLSSRSRSSTESTWEGEHGNISRDESPSSSPMSPLSNEDRAITSTWQTPEGVTTSCEVEAAPVCSHTEFEDMLANDVGVTLMIRNLPNKVMQGRILQQLVKRNLQDQVRLVYVPVEFGHSQKTLNKGFAFIHTNDRRTADTIIAMWHRTFVFGREGVRRSLNIALAHTQGLMQNMENWRKSTTSRIRNPHYSPLLVMGNGETVIMRSFNFSDLIPQVKDAEHTDSNKLQSRVPAALEQ